MTTKALGPAPPREGRAEVGAEGGDPPGHTPGGSGVRRSPSARAAIAGAVTIGFAYTFANVAVGFLIPLYALHLGFSLIRIGLLAALPAVFQMGIRIVSGSLTDAWGERPIWRLCFALGGAAALIAATGSGGAGPLVAAQVVMGFARALYSVTGQSYVSRLPGDRAQALGLFAAAGKAGSVAGLVAVGLLRSLAGFAPAFATLAGVYGFCLVLAFLLPAAEPASGRMAFGRALAAMPRSLLRPGMWLGGVMAFFAAVPQALSQSFYPVYVARLGGSSSTASAITALSSAGTVLAALLASALVRRLGRRAMSLVASALFVAGVAATGASPSLPAVSAAVLAAGLGAGVLNVLFLVITAEASSEGERATNLAAVSLFWILAMLVTPALVGVAAAQFGLGRGFVILSLALSPGGLVLPWLWRKTVGWHAPGGPPMPETSE